MKPIETIIFDIGGVLIDWNPRYLYRKIFDNEDQITWFLENICTSEWNDRQDGGRPFEEATQELVDEHPEWEEPIRAWYGRWQETVGGAIEPTIDLLRTLRTSRGHRLYALTNWSAETFPWALDNFHFLHWFEGIVVSGREKVCKPHPDIYRVLIKRYDVDPCTALFIDDNIRNVEGAIREGLQAVQFESPDQLRQELIQRRILIG